MNCRNPMWRRNKNKTKKHTHCQCRVVCNLWPQSFQLWNTTTTTTIWGKESKRCSNTVSKNTLPISLPSHDQWILIFLSSGWLLYVLHKHSWREGGRLLYTYLLRTLTVSSSDPYRLFAAGSDRPRQRHSQSAHHQHPDHHRHAQPESTRLHWGCLQRQRQHPDQGWRCHRYHQGHWCRWGEWEVPFMPLSTLVVLFCLRVIIWCWIVIIITIFVKGKVLSI